jgi:hypothetical protein
MQKDLDDFDIYGVDPGHRHLFTAINRGGVTRRFSNNEWYAKSGMKRRRYDQQERKKESGVVAFESSLPTKKTADAGNWLSYCDQIFTNFRLIATFYGADFASERFLNYQGHQKMASEVANIFVNGGKKYHHDRDGTE